MKTIRYGTKYFPQTKKLTIPPFQIERKFPLYPESNADRVPTSVSKEFPSISCIQTCMNDMKALLLWQEKMIAQLGLAGFRKMNTERLAEGTSFHSSAQKLLMNFAENKPQALSEILEKTPTKIHGYMQSLYPFMTSLNLNKNTTLAEKTVIHSPLKFKGRFDALFLYKDHLCMVDWKTASILSRVSKNIDDSHDINGLYSYPKQLSAYAGAFNSDPTFFHMGQVKSAAIVLVYNDGRECKCIEMNSAQLLEHWEQFHLQVENFWKRVYTGDSVIDFVCR